LDRRAQGWRLVILASLGICAVLAVCAAILFLQGVSEAQSAFRRFLAIADRGWEFRDDPRAFQPYVEIAILVASSAAAAVGARRISQWRIGWAVGPLSFATLGFGLSALGTMWSSQILHPCIDEGTFYDCHALVAGDRIALATLLLAVTGVLCGLTAVRTGYLAVRVPTVNNPG